MLSLGYTVTKGVAKGVGSLYLTDSPDSAITFPAASPRLAAPALACQVPGRVPAPRGKSRRPA